MCPASRNHHVSASTNFDSYVRLFYDQPRNIYNKDSEEGTSNVTHIGTDLRHINNYVPSHFSPLAVNFGNILNKKLY